MSELKFDNETAKGLYRIFAGLSTSSYENAQVYDSVKPNMKKAYDEVLAWGRANCEDITGSEGVVKTPTKLSLEIIEKYNFPKTITKPDHDDVSNNYTLPNGLELSALVVCFNEPTDVDSLEGLDGWIYIETEEELKELASLSYEEVLNNIKESDDDFDISEYL